MSGVRFIDANALSQSFTAMQECANMRDHVYLMGVLSLIDNTPTIDAVEVVRCKDCKYAIVNQNHIDKPLICCLTKMVGTTKEDWFCADGERKDGGAE